MYLITGDIMILSAPTRNVFFIAAIIGIIGIVAHFIPVPFATANQFWLVTIGFILLMVGTLFKEL